MTKTSIHPPFERTVPLAYALWEKTLQYSLICEGVYSNIPVAYVFKNNFNPLRSL